jgi:hypothetical protein
MTIESSQCLKCVNKTCSGRKLNRLGFGAIKCPFGGSIKHIKLVYTLWGDNVWHKIKEEK